MKLPLLGCPVVVVDGVAPADGDVGGVVGDISHAF